MAILPALALRATRSAPQIANQFGSGGRRCEQILDVALRSLERLDHQHALDRLVADAEGDRIPVYSEDLGTVAPQTAAAEVGARVFGRMQDGSFDLLVRHDAPNVALTLENIVQA